jgi:hypothetical protein
VIGKEDKITVKTKINQREMSNYPATNNTVSQLNRHKTCQGPSLGSETVLQQTGKEYKQKINKKCLVAEV